MSLFCPRGLIFFVFWWPGAPILDAVGILFGFRGALGALIAAPLVSLEGFRKKPAPQYCIAGTLCWKIVQNGAPKKVTHAFWVPLGILFAGVPP